ncbi:MAG: hypothetical protein M3N32_07780 [Actinomycetota bacterium]|nr:hypothetical protein [Actinomycetota bacterium]
MPWPVADNTQLPLARDYNDVLVDGTEFKEFVPRLSGDGGATELSLGSPSTQVGRIYRFGIFTYLNVFLRFGTSGATFGNGVYRVSSWERVPGAASPEFSSGQPLDQFMLGGGTIYDASTGEHYLITPIVDGGHWQFVMDRSVGFVAYNDPFVWAGGDYLMFWALYEREFHR